jgi:endonuclease G
MVPAADAKISQSAMDETFFLSNIAPQVGDGFNRHCKSTSCELSQSEAHSRLGVPGRFLSTPNDKFRRCLRIHVSPSHPIPEIPLTIRVPLYLPTLHPDGKYRVSYEVIGSPPSIAVPTHFAKVILASRPDFAYPQNPSKNDKTVTSPSTIKELAMGAFVLPNKEIPDHADLRSFIMPIQEVEKAAGLQLFNEELKGKSKQLCAVTQCQVIVRRFDDTRKQITGKK